MIEAFKEWIKQSRWAICGGMAVGVLAIPRCALAAVFLQAGPVTTDVSNAAHVNLYLADTDGAKSPIATDGGLAGAALQVVRSSGDAVITDLQLNPLFDDPFSQSSVAVDVATTSGSTGIGSPGVDFDTGTNRVLIGTLTLTRGSQDSEFTIEPLGSASGYFTTANSNISVDAGGVSLGSFTVTVPEPGVLASVTTGAMMMLRRRRSTNVECNV